MSTHAKGVREKKNIPGVEFFCKDTSGWTTYLRNQAHFYIRKYDDISNVGACRGCESCSLGTQIPINIKCSSLDSKFIISIISRQTVVHCTSKFIPLEKE